MTAAASMAWLHGSACCGPDGPARWEPVDGTRHERRAWWRWLLPSSRVGVVLVPEPDTSAWECCGRLVDSEKRHCSRCHQGLPASAVLCPSCERVNGS